MKKFLKPLISSALSAFNLKMVSAHRGQIAGADLLHDLPLFIGAESPVVFDVGANEGQSIAMFSSVWPNPKIFSFEPSSATYQALLQQELSDSVQLFNFGLGEKSEFLTFNNYRDSVMSSFLELDTSQDNPFERFAADSSYLESKESVEVVALDDFVADHAIDKIDLLKTDTQGFDLRVLKGAQKTLKAGKINHVLIEVNFSDMYQSQGSSQEIFQYLEEHELFLVDLYEKRRSTRHFGTLSWCTALFARRDNRVVLPHMPPI